MNEQEYTNDKTEYRFDNNQEKLPPIERGDYECTCDAIEYRVVPTTFKRYISFSFKIRSDIESNNTRFVGRHLYFSVWWSEKTNSYNEFQLGKIFNAIPRAESKVTIIGIENVVRAIKGQDIKVHVDYKSDENLNTRQDLTFSQTEYVHKIDSSVNDAFKTNYEDINDIDAPFK